MCMESNIWGSFGVPDLTHEIAKEDSRCVVSGACAEVYRGTWRTGGGEIERSVAIKVPRHYADESVNMQRRKTKNLRRQLRVWRRLSHENVLPFYGTTASFGVYPCMVCAWAEHGDLTKYLARKQRELRDSDRLRMLCEIAAGLNHLHEKDVIHGNLTGSNILIDTNNTCVLADAGLAPLLDEFHGISYLTSAVPGSVRWAAPELFTNAHGGSMRNLDKRSDVFSFGRVILQVFTGQVPYAHLPLDSTVVVELYRRRDPPRPDEMPDAAWDLATACWAHSPPARPDARACLERVRQALAAAPRRPEDESPGRERAEDGNQGQPKPAERHPSQRRVSQLRDGVSGGLVLRALSWSHRRRPSSLSRHASVSTDRRSGSMRAVSPKLHTFARHNPAETMQCRVCLRTDKAGSSEGAVVCTNCGLTAHWRCAAEGLLDRVPLCGKGVYVPVESEEAEAESGRRKEGGHGPVHEEPEPLKEEDELVSKRPRQSAEEMREESHVHKEKQDAVAM